VKALSGKGFRAKIEFNEYKNQYINSEQTKSDFGCTIKKSHTRPISYSAWWIN